MALSLPTKLATAALGQPLAKKCHNCHSQGKRFQDVQIHQPRRCTSGVGMRLAHAWCRGLESHLLWFSKWKSAPPCYRHSPWSVHSHSGGFCAQGLPRPSALENVSDSLKAFRAFLYSLRYSGNSPERPQCSARVPLVKEEARLVIAGRFVVSFISETPLPPPGFQVIADASNEGQHHGFCRDAANLSRCLGQRYHRSHCKDQRRIGLICISP